MTPEPLWRPSHERVERAALSAFRRAAGFDDYDALWRWSVERREEFWPAVWDFCGVVASRRCDTVLDNDGMPGAHWFAGSRLNFAENLLRRRDDAPAIIARTEAGRRELSFAELYAEVARAAAWMRHIGVTAADRVAAYMPNVPETVIAALAAASIGAAFSSCSPDFGTAGAVERFGQINPTLLIAADGYVYKQQGFDTLPRVVEIVNQLQSVRHTLIVPHVAERPTPDGLPSPAIWSDMPLASGDIEFEQLPFDHPLYVLFSSGTTGRPKCIIHGAGGTLLQHLKEHRLHTDIQPGDRLFYMTTCGWMMWNWLATALASEATIVLYDGAATHPSPAAMFDLVDAEGVTAFGTSAKFVAGVERAGVRPRDSHKLDSLRTVLSTGSPLPPESFEYIYRDVKSDVCLSSISGGTDIVSCFALGDPTGPVWPGELQRRGLGMKVEVFDDEGRGVVGEKGELVCTAAFPSMPVAFANDPDGSKYRDAYFGRFPGVWHHGDYAELTPHGGLVIHGRSDAILNPGGVRIGTAEIYRLVEQLPEVAESVAVGQDWRGDVRVILFVKLAEGVPLTDELASQIKRHIRAGATPRHAPAKVIAVPAIPRTKSGKVVELAVREVIHGRPVKNQNALADPDSLQHFRDLPELYS